jgi:hypothetical protein
VIVGQLIGGDTVLMVTTAVALAAASTSVALGVWWVFGKQMRESGWEW